MNIRILYMAVLLLSVCLFFSTAANAKWLDKADGAVSGLLDQVMNKTEAARDYLDQTADERQEFYRDLNSEAEKAYNKSKEYIDENKDDWHQAYNSTKEKIKQDIEGAQKYVYEHEGEWRATYELVRDRIRGYFSDLLKTWKK
ncbi:hypothetical protein [Maridesulfovibrio sp.]|uniref:hypothetical protein n=1 Tax=Maridesulfovibrio sp. TaxID=2795000 RepID=UPI003AFF8069